jgi:hypothetical protein
MSPFTKAPAGESIAGDNACRDTLSQKLEQSIVD